MTGNSGACTWNIHTVDYHTAGEPFRIVDDVPFGIAGATVLERRQNAQALCSAADTLRRLLVNEPRGHADMYGGFIVPPNDLGAHFGVLFWHKDGFSTACGHGTMALGVWAIRTGRVPIDPTGTTRVVIDVPSGRVSAIVQTAVDRVENVTFRNVPSRVTAREVAIETVDFGTVSVDLVWGGATYACVRSADLDLQVAPENLPALIEAGRQVKAALKGHPAAQHPTDRRLDGVYGAIIFEDAEFAQQQPPPDEQQPRPAGSVAQRNVTIFADGQVDRSPCGSGTAARAAALAESGELAPGGALEHYSLIGSRFIARVVERSTEGTVVDVVGTSHPVAESRFSLDPTDELGLGFTLR